MKQGSTLFLKFILCVVALCTLVGLVWFPQTEGRATGLSLLEIYSDPLIIYSYIASIPFFVGLYQAFKLLNLIDANKAFSQRAVNTLKTMKLASISLIAFILIALFYIRFLIPNSVNDDPAGPTMLGIIMSLAFGIIATAASVFEKLFQNAVDIKEENDLTV